MIRICAIILGFNLFYAVVRYIVFGPVEPIHIPVYIVNKAIAMSAVVFLFLTAQNHAKGSQEMVRFWGKATLHFAFVHILLSLAILSEAYYPKFFSNGKLNLNGELTMLFGALAAYCMWCIRGTGSDFFQRKMLKVIATGLIAGHLIAMGYKGWLTPEKWYGGIPPISLAGFVIAIATLAFFLKAKKTTNG